ncbi:MAG: hypothetical protein IKA30_00110 [Alphaproteobacteria bacterium]|nr:hypothetical protein [Alphaproteobacteria bacterium]
MKKVSFVMTLIISGVISTSALAQNYYDPGFYQNDGYGYNNGGYAYQQGYNYPQNYGYYFQQPNRQQPSQYYAQQPQKNLNPTKINNERQQKGVGTVSIGADYVLGYSKFESKKYNLGEIINGGGDYKFSTSDFERRSNSVSLNMGWRPFKYIGIEAFYLTSLDKSQDENVLSNTYYPEYAGVEKEVSYKSYGLDILGYYPMNDYIEFLASIGVGKYDVEADIVVSARDVGVTPSIIRSKSQSFEDSVTAYRIGGGFQFWLSKHLAFRVMGRWTNLGGDFIKYITEVNIGVRYHF